MLNVLRSGLLNPERLVPHAKEAASCEEVTERESLWSQARVICQIGTA